MRLQLVHPWAGQTFNHPAGKIVDVADETIADQLLTGRHAVPAPEQAEAASGLPATLMHAFFEWLKTRQPSLLREAPEEAFVPAFAPAPMNAPWSDPVPTAPISA
jgi:hypothetical protein